MVGYNDMMSKAYYNAYYKAVEHFAKIHEERYGNTKEYYISLRKMALSIDWIIRDLQFQQLELKNHLEKASQQLEEVSEGFFLFHNTVSSQKIQRYTGFVEKNSLELATIFHFFAIELDRLKISPTEFRKIAKKYYDESKQESPL